VRKRNRRTKCLNRHVFSVKLCNWAFPGSIWNHGQTDTEYLNDRIEVMYIVRYDIARTTSVDTLVLASACSLPAGCDRDLLYSCFMVVDYDAVLFFFPFFRRKMYVCGGRARETKESELEVGWMFFAPRKNCSCNCNFPKVCIRLRIED